MCVGADPVPACGAYYVCVHHKSTVKCVCVVQVSFETLSRHGPWPGLTCVVDHDGGSSGGCHRSLPNKLWKEKYREESEVIGVTTFTKHLAILLLI